MLTGENGRSLVIINHHCLRLINLGKAGRTQRHKSWYAEHKWHLNAAPKMWSQSVRWGFYNTGCKLRKALPAKPLVLLTWNFHTRPPDSPEQKSLLHHESRYCRFFASLHNVKNSKMNRTFERLTLSSPNFAIRLWGRKIQISIINESDWSKNMAARDPCIFAMGWA